LKVYCIWKMEENGEPELVAETNNEKLSKETTEEKFKKIETHLFGKISKGDKNAQFLLGQFYYEEGKLNEAIKHFEEIKDNNVQAMYQLSTIYYDGIGCQKKEKKAFKYMMKIATSEDVEAAHLKHSAMFNVGKAYFEGFGVKQDDKEAEKWWVLAAGDGDPRASVEAQTMLGMFYSRPEFLNLKKSFFWHSEACGNGSLESQGILGVMYLRGEGIGKNKESGFNCLKMAAERGNVYAQGRLVEFYYKNKLYTKSCDLAKKVVLYDNIENLADDTSCLASYITKGIALACFYLSRCLLFGKGLKKNLEESDKYLKRVCELDVDLAYDCQKNMTFGYV